MKFSAEWFKNGEEVDLPDMKIEGTIAVANLTKDHVDEFLPFLNAIQKESAARLQMQIISATILPDAELTPEQLENTRKVLQVRGITPDDDTNELIGQCKDVLPSITKEFADYASKAAKVSITANPFFLERSLIQAYYMLKAYVWNSAREIGKSPKMPFNMQQLREMIDEPQLQMFLQYAFAKMREEQENSAEKPEVNEEELKKKSVNTQGTSKQQ